jgi:hypothetical protein
VSAALEWKPADGSLIVVPDRRKHPCSRCGGPRNVPGQAYCRSCHAASMREQRAKQRAELAEMRRLLHVHGLVERETEVTA